MAFLISWSILWHFDCSAAEFGTLSQALVRAHHHRYLLLLNLLLINQLKWFVIEIGALLGVRVHCLGRAVRVGLACGGFAQAYEYLLLQPLLAEGALGLVLIGRFMLWMMIFACIFGHIIRVLDEQCRRLGARFQQLPG